MTLQEVKDFLGTLSEDQLKNPFVFFPGDDDEAEGTEINSWYVSEEDMYWEHHGDVIGNLEQVKDTFGDDWENEIEELIKIPKGTVTFHGL